MNKGTRINRKDRGKTLKSIASNHTIENNQAFSQTDPSNRSMGFLRKHSPILIKRTGAAKQKKAVFRKVCSQIS